MEIRELISALDASLVKVASHPDVTEEAKLSESLKQVQDAASALKVVWKAREHLSAHEKADYEFAKDKILVYLLFYDRALRYQAGDATPGDWYRTDMYAPADYNDWRRAQSEARKLFVTYIKKAILDNSPKS